ncbi:hypothetical protein L7F22_059292 [Adiantum nelumboides]|nr:hypothetical protein [Adiantum nelumboides]
MPSKSHGGAFYYVTFIDDATRHVWVYAMKSKDETFSCLKKLLFNVESQFEHKLKTLRSDNGGEYVSKEFADLCSSRGIKREFTVPYTPAQNDVAERMNRNIQEQNYRALQKFESSLRQAKRHLFCTKERTSDFSTANQNHFEIWKLVLTHLSHGRISQSPICPFRILSIITCSFSTREWQLRSAGKNANCSLNYALGV